MNNKSIMWSSASRFEVNVSKKPVTIWQVAFHWLLCGFTQLAVGIHIHCFVEGKFYKCIIDPDKEIL